ncbi:hypothetical protein ES708_11847 [subsurface metagenome]
MAKPQPTDAHLRIAHSITEAIMLRDFTKRQRKILDLILRLSWGCNEKYAYIPRQRDFSTVGVHEVDIKKELDWLCESHIIFRDGELYAFNKNFDAWQVSRVKPYQPQELSKLLSLNLGKDRPQLSETLSQNLVKHEVSTKRNTKFATPKLATAKERGGEGGVNPPSPPKERLKKDILPEWIEKETWEAFLEMRKKKRAIPTEKAKQLLIKELEKLKREGHDPNEVLNQSIMRNYTGVFPLKGGQGGTYKQRPRKLTDKYTRPED